MTMLGFRKKKQIARDWQTPDGFQSSNDGSSCMAVRTFTDGSVVLKSTVTGGRVRLTAAEWEAAKLAIRDGQYDN
jgi:hypothetical protein